MLGLEARIHQLLNRIHKLIHPDPGEVYWLSLGENCLPDNILQRHGLKSFSTPYSHGRSNIDYAISLERKKYRGFLHKKNLTYEYLGKLKVVRSKIINKCDNIYDGWHMKGFEMTHHDVIQSDKERSSFKRKIKRLRHIRGKSNVVFFYHHRVNNNTNLDLIFQKTNEFLNFYLTKNNQCYVIVFSQKIVDDHSERKVFFKRINSNILFYEFHSEHQWSGTNNDIFWARNDDDLIKKMIDTSISIIKSKSIVNEGFIP